MSQLVDLKVGFSCNNRCRHCVVSDKFNEKDLTLNEIKNLIETYIDNYGTISLTLTGGEVTIRKDYLQILDFIYKKKNENLINFVDIQTNGRFLSRNDVLAKTLSVVDFYLIALHSSDCNVHNNITRCKTSFQETTEALSKLITKVNDKSIAIQTVISQFNYEGLQNIYKFCFENYGIKEFNITFPHPIGWANSIEVTPRYTTVSKSINESLAYCLDNGIKPFIEAIPLCVFNDQHRDYAKEFYKNRTAEVVGFAGKKYGHIDYSVANQEGYSKYKLCNECCYKNDCIGVWREYIELYPHENLMEILTQLDHTNHISTSIAID
jgi:MoaA/NifB/PqqE/SkfB family radical SAM enzyme